MTLYELISERIMVEFGGSPKDKITWFNVIGKDPSVSSRILALIPEKDRLSLEAELMAEKKLFLEYEKSLADNTSTTKAIEISEITDKLKETL